MFAVRSLQWSRQPAVRRPPHPTDIDRALMRGRTTSLDAMPLLPPQSAKPKPLTIKWSPSAVSSLQVVPLALILLVFFLLPTTLFLVVSFFDYDRTGLYPSFMFDNYRELLTSPATLRLYGSTLKFAVIVWAITLFLGFNIAYFLIFHVRSNAVRVVFLLLCAIPFLTSAIIRTIAWIPFLGRNGAFNQALMTLQLTSRPLDFLLFSDFAVIVSYVHLYTLLMIGPIANSLGRNPSEPVGGRARCRRQSMADDDQRRHPAVGDRHRARLDLGGHPGDGRLFRGSADQRRTERVDRLGAVDGDPGDAVSAGRGQRHGAGRRGRHHGDVHDAGRGCPEGIGGIADSHGDLEHRRKRWRRAAINLYALAILFGIFLVFLYGPMLAWCLRALLPGPGRRCHLSNGSVSVTWFADILEPGQMANIPVSFSRSVALATIVSVATVAMSVAAGLAFVDLSRGRACCSILRSQAWSCPAFSSVSKSGLGRNSSGSSRACSPRRSQLSSPGRCHSACSPCSP